MDANYTNELDSASRPGSLKRLISGSNKDVLILDDVKLKELGTSPRKGEYSDPRMSFKDLAVCHKTSFRKSEYETPFYSNQQEMQDDLKGKGFMKKETVDGEWDYIIEPT